jgi:hypothetical protein
MKGERWSAAGDEGDDEEGVWRREDLGAGEESLAPDQLRPWLDAPLNVGRGAPRGFGSGRALALR